MPLETITQYQQAQQNQALCFLSYPMNLQTALRKTAIIQTLIIAFKDSLKNKVVAIIFQVMYIPPGQFNYSI